MKYWDKITAYLKARRRGAQANELEREAAHDPFLNDALEGFAVANNDAQMLADIQQLQQRVAQRGNKRTHNNTLWRWMAASVAVLLVAGAGYWALHDSEPKDQLAVVQDNEQHLPESAERTINNTNKHFEVETEFSDKSNKEFRASESEMIIESSTKSASAPSSAKQDLLVADMVMEESSVKDEKTAIAGDMNQNEPTSRKIQEEQVVVGFKIAKADTARKDMYYIAATEKQQSATSVMDYDMSKSVQYDKIDSKKELSKLARKADTIQVVPDSKVLEPVIGFKSYEKYLKENLMYPADASERKLEGTVVLSFMVDKNGRPYNFAIVQGLSESCNKEAIRLVSTGCNWTTQSTTGATKAIVKVVFKL